MRRWEVTLEAIERSIDEAWETTDGDAGAILADPSAHPWRVVDAALDRTTCEECFAPLGSGRRGCDACDLADGFRFAAREEDREHVPPGNEHAIRVATAVLRAPHRYPPFAVAGNRLYLPLFLAGLMPTRAQQLSLKRALERGPVDVARLEVARSFEDLVAIAWLEAQSSQ